MVKNVLFILLIISFFGVSICAAAVVETVDTFELPPELLDKMVVEKSIPITAERSVVEGDYSKVSFDATEVRFEVNDTWITTKPRITTTDYFVFKSDAAFSKSTTKTVDNTIEWSTATANVKYIYTDTKLKEFITLQQPSGIVVSYSLAAGCVIAPRGDGTFNVANKDGENKIIIEKPFAIDANEKRFELDWELDENKSTFTLVGDLSGAVYPIVVDPTEVVDNVNWGERGTSIDTDSNDYPHIAYWDDTNDDVKHAYKNESGWHTEIVESLATSPSFAGHVSIAIDTSDNIHISYLDGANSALKYAYKNATGWYTTTLVSVGYVGYYNSIDTDSNDYAHIMYCNTGNGALYHAYEDGLGWHYELVDNSADARYTSIVVDNNDCLHVSYHANIDGNVKYAYKNAAGWFIEFVDNDSDIDGKPSTSIDIDSNNYPHICYYDQTGRDLEYAYKNAVGWHFETIKSTGDVGTYNSIKIDSNNYPHVAYYVEATADLEYAYKNTEGWHSSTIDSSVLITGWYTSLVIGNNDSIHISYYDISPTGRLKYYYKSPPPPVAAFTMNSTSGDAPLSISFTDQSTIEPTTWNWDFGDGTGSTDRNPVHTYTENGNYQVTLTVSNQYGSSSESKYINVYIPYSYTLCKINFQTSSFTTPSGYIPDIGNTFGTQNGYSYGWNTSHTANARIRSGNTDPLLSSMIFNRYTDELDWKIAVPNGNYNVTVVCHDSQYATQNTVEVNGNIYFNNLLVNINTPAVHSETINVTNGFIRLTKENELNNDKWGALAYIIVESILDPPTANFVSNSNTGDAPHSVTFADLSDNSPSSWYWDFGDGTHSTAQNPSHSYTAPGVYTVSLTATNNGGSDSEIKTNYIYITPSNFPYKINFQPTTSEVPAGYIYDDGSLYGVRGGLTFGWGETKTTHARERNINVDQRLDTMVFTQYPYELDWKIAVPNGNYNVTVVCHDSQYATYATVEVNENVYFDDEYHAADSSAIHSENILVSDGFIRLTNANDDDSGADDYTCLAYIIIEPGLCPPTAEFASNITDGNVPLNVVFTDLSNNDPTIWNWDFGDGGYSSLQNPTHEYSAFGTYSVNLSVSNVDGSDYELKLDYIVVHNATPSAAFSTNVTMAYVNEPIAFTDESTGTIHAYNWAFGDDSYSTSQNQTHAYTSAGVYTVNLTVSNDGGSDSMIKTDCITILNKPPTADFSANNTEMNENSNIRFTDTSTGYGIDTWMWEFGNGVTSTEQNPIYAYPTFGTYTVRLTVSNDGGSDTKTGNILIHNATAVPDFTANRTEVNEEWPIQFNDTSLGTVFTWDWNFGDGTGSTDRNPVHRYSHFGTYTVNLTTSNDGGTTFEEKVGYIIVHNATPIAQFNVNRTEVNEYWPIQFTDGSLGTVHNYLWEFGNGVTSTDRNPVYAYPTFGTYTVRLTVSNDGGDDIEEKISHVIVHNATPVINDFTANVLESEYPVSIHFTPDITGTVHDYYWDFGDGTGSSTSNPDHTYTYAGWFTVELDVTNDGGQDAMTKTTYIRILSYYPTCDWATSFGGDRTLRFIDHSYVGEFDEPITEYSWDFGDGATSTEKNPVHFYPSIGQGDPFHNYFDVTHGVKNARGWTYTTATVDVHNNPNWVPVKPESGTGIDWSPSKATYISTWWNSEGDNLNADAFIQSITTAIQEHTYNLGIMIILFAVFFFLAVAYGDHAVALVMLVLAIPSITPNLIPFEFQIPLVILVGILAADVIYRTIKAVLQM